MNRRGFLRLGARAAAAVGLVAAVPELPGGEVVLPPTAGTAAEGVTRIVANYGPTEMRTVSLPMAIRGVDAGHIPISDELLEDVVARTMQDAIDERLLS